MKATLPRKLDARTKGINAAMRRAAKAAEARARATGTKLVVESP